MNLTRRAVKLWMMPSGVCDRTAAKHNVREWLKAVEYLGDHWVMSPKRYAEKQEVEPTVLKS